LNEPRSVRRILVIEDELDTAQTLALILKGVGHEVQFAISAEAGLDCARKFRPQVVFLDLLLPDGDGCDVARTLKHEHGGLLVFAFTGFGTEQLRRRAMRSGCDAYLEKPMEPAAIEALLRKPPVTPGESGRPRS
jgi:DNA-binding response OmpR family regulator